MKAINLKSPKTIIALAVVLLALVAPAVIDNSYILQSLIMIVLYAYLACSWNIIGGFGGQFSLGHSVYFGIGAYISTLMFNLYQVTPWIGMLVGAVISGLLAILISYPCFKLSGSYFTLATIAFLHVIRLLITTQDKILGFETRGAQGLQVKWRNGGLLDMQFQDKRDYLYVILLLLAVVLMVSYYIRHSKTGYYLAAINTNQNAAESLGVDVTRYKLKAMFISAVFTAIGGTFYAQLILFLDPQRIFGADFSMEIMLFAVVGGAGTIWGPLLGAVLLVPINELTRSYFGAQYSGLGPLLYGLILCLVVFFLPGGLLPNMKAFYKKHRNPEHRETKKALD